MFLSQCLLARYTCEADKAMQNDFELSCSSVLSGPFDSVCDFKYGDPLSCDLFKFVMESVLRKAGVHCNGTVLQKSVQLLDNADDIDIIGRTKRVITAAFSAIEWEFTKMGPAVETCALLILRLRPITVVLQLRDFFTFALPLPSKMVSAWRSNVGSLLLKDFTMVTLGN